MDGPGLVNEMLELRRHKKAKAIAPRSFFIRYMIVGWGSFVGNVCNVPLELVVEIK